MPEYTIHVSEEVAEYIREEARRQGSRPEDEFLTELVRDGILSRAGGDSVHPLTGSVLPGQTPRDIAVLLQEGLDSAPSVEWTPELQASMRQSLEEEILRREKSRAAE